MVATPESHSKMALKDKGSPLSAQRIDWWTWLPLLRGKRTNLRLNVCILMDSKEWLGQLIRGLGGESMED